MEKKAAEITGRFPSLSDSIKATEAAMSVNAELKTASFGPAKARPVCEGGRAARCSKKYPAEHEADITAYRAAEATLNRLRNGGKLLKMDGLKAEFRKLAADKKAACREYRAAKKELQAVITTKANIGHVRFDGRAKK